MFILKYVCMYIRHIGPWDPYRTLDEQSIQLRRKALGNLVDNWRYSGVSFSFLGKLPRPRFSVREKFCLEKAFLLNTSAQMDTWVRIPALEPPTSVRWPPSALQRWKDHSVFLTEMHAARKEWMDEKHWLWLLASGLITTSSQGRLWHHCFHAFFK